MRDCGAERGAQGQGAGLRGRGVHGRRVNSEHSAFAPITHAIRAHSTAVRAMLSNPHQSKTLKQPAWPPRPLLTVTMGRSFLGELSRVRVEVREMTWEDRGLPSAEGVPGLDPDPWPDSIRVVRESARASVYCAASVS